MFTPAPHDPTSGFWDDGDWISWDDIEEYRHDYEIRDVDGSEVFSEIAVDVAARERQVVSEEV